MTLTKMTLAIIAASIVAGSVGLGRSGTVGRSLSAVSTEELLGESVDQVLALLGEPAGACGSASTLSFAYEDEGGTVHDPAIVFSGGVAIYVEPALESLPVAGRTPPHDRPTLGMPVARLPVLLGSPTDLSIGRVSAELTYVDGLRVTVCQNRVIGLGQR